MSKSIISPGMFFLFVATALAVSCTDSGKSVFLKDNITPWCIVPFDAKQRTPAERAEMLERLGFKTVAYDWRDAHIPQFDEEVIQLRKHGITMTAFWWAGGLPAAEEVLKTDEKMNLQLDFIRRNALNLEVWVAIMESDYKNDSLESRTDVLARRIDILAGELNKAGCRLGIYNHGGWAGMPDNMIGIVKKTKTGNVGIVYNFHHAHEHLDLMPSAFERMLPYLYCVNLNGMNREGPKILPLGEGREDEKIIRMIATSGYSGPVGIIGHTAEEDVEIVLKRNLDGLKKLLISTGDRAAVESLR
jgi:sugar phosphate isomerase/epimerase